MGPTYNNQNGLGGLKRGGGSVKITTPDIMNNRVFMALTLLLYEHLKNSSTKQLHVKR